MNKYINIIFVLFLNFLVLSGLWAIDIGVSGIVMGGMTKNILFIRDPNSQYHLGLGLVYISFLILSCLFIYYLVGEKNGNS